MFNLEIKFFDLGEKMWEKKCCTTVNQNTFFQPGLKNMGKGVSHGAQQIKLNLSTDHGRRRYVDAGHGPGPDVVGHVAEDDAVLQRGRQVAGQTDPQSGLHVGAEALDVGVGRSGLFRSVPPEKRDSLQPTSTVLKT